MPTGEIHEFPSNLPKSLQDLMGDRFVSVT